MKNKKKLMIAFLCIAIVVAFAASVIAICTKENQKETIEVQQEDDAQYRFTYVRVGGTDEEPIYNLVIEVIGDEPLVIQGGTILGGEMEDGE